MYTPQRRGGRKDDATRSALHCPFLPAPEKKKRQRPGLCRSRRQTHYLGPHGTPESLEAYQRFVAEWRANRGEIAAAAGAVTVVEVLNQFRKLRA